MERPRLLGLGLRLLLLSMALWLWLGFLYPDPFYVDGPQRLYRMLLWGCRLGIPLLLLAGATIDRRIRSGRMHPGVLPLLAAGLSAGLLVVYPLASLAYERAFTRRLTAWHPYLQLDPPLYKPRLSIDDALPVRVFCLGGSTTEWVDSKRRGWPERVETRLNAGRTERPVEVSNLGRQWYTTLHSLINYQVNLRPHRPDVILVMHAINDVLHNADFSYFSRGPFRGDYGHFYGPVSRLARARSLAQFLSTALGAVWFHQPRQIVETADFPGLVSFERNIRTIVSLARIDGTTVVLMTQPNLYSESITPAQRAALDMLNREAVGPDRQWSYETARRAMRDYNDAVRRIAHEERLTLIDLEPAVPKTLGYFKDDVHYTDAGFDLVAAQVAQGLEANASLARAPAQP